MIWSNHLHQQTFSFQKFFDNAQKCFAFTPQANFPAHNLNFHWRWRWWDQIQATFETFSTLLMAQIEIFGQRVPKAIFVFHRKNRQRPFGILCITFIMTIDQEIGKITFATNNKKKPIEASWITKYELGFKMQEKHFGRKLLLFWIFSFKTLQKIVSIEKKNHCSDLIWYASLLISTGFQFSWSHFWNDLSNHLYNSVNKRSFLEIINLYFIIYPN